MQVSYNWLKAYLPDLKLTVQETAVLLTDIGLEVEAIEPFESVKGGLKNLVVGYVVDKQKHPDADRLSVTKVKVDNSDALHQIVCGAPNVAAGQKVVVALPGTTIYPLQGEPFKIKLSKIRGVESAGMLCAEDEIGLGKSHDGILVLDENAVIGSNVADLYNIQEDAIIHIGLTPNRIDAASHIGVARDLRAALQQRNNNKVDLNVPKVNDLPLAKQSYKVNLNNPEACNKYIAVEIENIKVGPSPAWLKNRLESVGARSINNVVDIANFVMLECGHPLHAFDANQIDGAQINVRLANENEELLTLDGQTRKLSSKDLVIADATKPMCIAGVFGGLKSGVTEKTVNMVLEAAWFNPVYIRKTARKHELFTDASFRYERGVDPELTLWAASRAVDLIVELTGGKLKAGYTMQHINEVKPVEITVNFQQLNAFSGCNIPVANVKSILRDLDFKTIAEDDNSVKVLAPLYRVDVTRTIDVFEEILRIYGYNNIPIPSKINATPQLVQGIYHENLIESISAYLADKGFHEIMNNSLTSSKLNALNALENAVPVALLNPLSSEMDTMRTTLLFGGLQSIAYNINRQNPNLYFFEIGNVYAKQNDAYVEEQELGIWIIGERNTTSWQQKADEVGYYTLKGVVESLLGRFVKTNITHQFNVETQTLFDAFTTSVGKDTVVTAGCVKHNVLKQFDVDRPVYYAVFSIKTLKEAIRRTKFKYQEVSKYPVIKRDLSLLLDKEIGFETIRQVVEQADKHLIKKVDVFDVYSGKNLGENKKSYAISLTITDDTKTMRDEDVEKLMTKVIKGLTEKTGAVLR